MWWICKKIYDSKVFDLPAEEAIIYTIKSYGMGTLDVPAGREKRRRIMELKILPAWDYPQEIRSLFSEYTEMLVEGDPAFREYLAVQNYEDELEHLEQKYGMPDGRLYVAFCDGKAAGCIGLRKIDEENCEMKRLYVRPEFRGRRIGEQLAQKIIDDAEKMGYDVMLLDTLPFLQAAVHMYEKLGFSLTERYNDSPMASSVYMKRNLR